MKIDRLEAHDRLLLFKNQSDYISQGCQDCIRNRPGAFGNHPFYIFVHKREIGMDERFSIFLTSVHKSIEDVPSARLIWSPRLTKPKAQTNSMLFKAYPPTDEIKVIWMLPDRAIWPQYVKGNLTEHPMISESIHAFENNRASLEGRESDDLQDWQIENIYGEVGKEGLGK